MPVLKKLGVVRIVAYETQLDTNQMMFEEWYNCEGPDGYHAIAMLTKGGTLTVRVTRPHKARED